MQNSDMFKPKEVLLLLFIIVLTTLLPIINNWTTGIIVFDSLSEVINKQIVYQLVTFFIAIVFLLVLRWTKKTEFHLHFRKGNLSAAIVPEPMIGIKPTKNENWSHLGRNFAIIISTVTAVVIYFQLIKNNGVSIENILKVLPFSLIFALFNSFVEETITRLGVVVVLKNVLKDKTIALLSAMIFGTVHYWGNPGGIAGVLLAGFLGWLLAKSILEIKGIFWAWFIHFLQDVIIFSALLTAM